MKDFKYTTIFSSLKIKPLVSEEKDRYLALASLADVGNFIPEIDTQRNVDLLPIAFNACVVNRVNKNGDVVDTSTAIEMYKSFVNKPINIEHNRQKVIGTILSAGFSEFGTDLPLTEEQAKKMPGPFNITLGGVVWKVVNSHLTDVIENSNDPTSEDYQKISASWELGFSEYHLLLMENENKNIESAKVIDAPEKVSELRDCLKSLGGSGKTESGEYIYRKVIGSVVPLGIGLTENPAADVIGVATKTIASVVIEPIEAGKTEEFIENISSHERQIDVKKINKMMKINTIQDITEESVKELTASSISVFIEEELKKASEKFAEEKGAVEAALKTNQEKNEALTVSYDSMKAELEKVQAALTELQKIKAARDVQETFNSRMAEFDAEFDLDDEDRSLLASEIKDLSEEAYSAFNKKMFMFWKNKKKDKNKKKEEAAASVEPTAVESKEDVKRLVESALDSAKVEPTTIPLSSAAKEPTTLEKYKKAFTIDQFEFNR